MSIPLAANFSGAFEWLLCFALHAVLALAALIHIVRLCTKPAPSPPRIFPRWLTWLTVISIGSAFWTIAANDLTDEVSPSFLPYLAIAPANYLLCIAAAFLTARFKAPGRNF